MSEQSQYRKLAKNTAILGGAQIVQMVVSLVRAKVIAVLIGPAGMGINALILSAISIIQQFSSGGIFQGGIRDLSHTYNAGDHIKFARLRKIFNRLTLISGIFGLVVCVALSPFLSDFAFGNKEYTWSFVAVSITLLFMSLHSGKTTILQATQNLRLLAKASIVGAVLNLAITVPMFFFWEINGIVPALISGYAVFYLVNKYFESKIVFATVDAPSRAQMIARSKPIMKFGFALMISNLVMVIFTFSLNGFINYFGSVEDVGLFQAASAICIQAMAIINTTLASDYFPRLSAIHSDHQLLGETIGRQAEMTVLMIVPIAVLMFVLAPLIIRILYTDEYLVIMPILRIMSLSLIFKAIWLVLGFVALARGDKKTYMIFDAFLGNGLCFLLNIGAFYFFNLYGLGISYLLGAIVMTIILSIVIKVKYNFSFNFKFILLLLALLLLMCSIYVCEELLNGIARIIATSLIAMVTVCYCFYRLDKILNVIGLIKQRFAIKRY